MKKSKKTYHYSKIYFLTISTLLILAVSLVGIFWVRSEYLHNEETLQSNYADTVSERKTKVKTQIKELINSIEYQKNNIETRLKKDLSDYTEQAREIADAIYRESVNTLPEKRIKQLIISALMEIRFFDGRGYFWIHDTNHTLVAHPFRQKFIGRNDRELTDCNGQKFVQSFIQTAKTNIEGGFVSYCWSKPESNQEYNVKKGLKKIAHLRYFKPFNWVIGCGEYVDDSSKQLQKTVIERISTIRFGTKKGYVFNHDRNGVCLNHIHKKNIGKNRWQLKNSNGVKIVQELNRIGRQPGGGFFEYIGTINPETGKPARKISYVQGIKDWGWVLGSGIYTADIEKKFQLYSAELSTELRNRIVKTLLFLGAILALAILVNRKLSNQFRDELNLFSTKSSDEKGKPIDLDQFRIEELRIIGQYANELLSEKEQTRLKLDRARRMESLGIMAGGVAHDLNNILAGIVGYPELLLADLPKDSKFREPLKAIRESGRRAATVVADLLTVARGAATIREHCNLETIVREYFLSPEYIKLKSHHPEVQSCDRFEASHPGILCSSVHIKKCIMNLMTNAIEAADPSGEVSLNLENRKISSAESEKIKLIKGDYVILSIKDNGPGISATNLPHIFEPFFTKKEMGRSGTGLGLTVVWNTMEDHNGKVMVNSDDNGTCFQLFFPVSEKVNETQQKNKSKKNYPGNKEHILVVDDEKQLRDLASRMLLSMGYKVDTVISGEKAVEFVRHSPVDLLVLDMLMEPGINGRQTYEKILQLYPKQKAVIVSGFSESNDVEQVMKLGAGGFVKKPYSMAELGRAIHEVLASKKEKIADEEPDMRRVRQP